MLPFPLQLKTLEEKDLAPNWNDAGAAKSKKRKGAPTKDLEKRKKAATSSEAQDTNPGKNAPLKR